jgi:parallel beta-helix repeat protein
MRAALVTLLLTFSSPLLASPPIDVTAHDVDALDAEGNLDLSFLVRNLVPFDLAGVTAVADLSAGFVFVKAHDADCAQSGKALRCTLPTIGAGQTRVFDIVLKPPAMRGRFLVPVAVTAQDSTVHAVSHIVLGVPFVVTAAADAGPGSLRQAIVDANRDCVAGVPCRISFSIQEPLPERGWYTIEPLSPLPPIEASEIVVDGKYLNGVPIEIRGTHAYGDGLVFRGANVTLSGLSIDGFWSNGVVAENVGQLLIANNVIGSDPSGAPLPNGLRGITIVRSYGTIRDNTISGNARSGIFITGETQMRILDNHIANNGASGIYVGPSFSRVGVQGNVISGNRDFPIGIDAGAALVAVRENVMVDNGAPFDIGMDGMDVHVLPRGSRIEPRPAITSAAYDAASGDTIVTIELNPLYVNFDTDTVYVFANRGLDRAGRAEAETFVGTVSTMIDARSPRNVTLVFRAHADLRGQILTAMTLRSSNFEFETQDVSSELSDGVVVR